LRSRPPQLSDDDLRAALGHIDELQYLPVGAGSYHWRADDRFVTVDDLDDKPFLGDNPEAVFDGLRRALGTAVALRQTGLDFVVAPLPAIDGEVVHRLGAHYAVSVYPWLGELKAFRKTLSDDERSALREILARLHSAPGSIASLAREVRPEVPHRAGLDRAVKSLTVPPVVGDWLARFDDLVAALEARAVERVVTHGEPHSGNIIRTESGFVLVDWDMLGLAPRERDLWVVAGGDSELCELYRLRWRLDDISWAVREMTSGDAEIGARALRNSLEYEPFTRD